jgi:hypothetical protein
MRITLLLTIVLITSCSPQKKAKRQLERAERLISKAKVNDPTIVRIDTVEVPVMVPVPGSKIDTVVVRDTRTDTLVIENERIRVRYHYDTITRTEFLEGECLPDTIKIKVRVPSERLIIRETFWDSVGVRPWKFWLLFIIAAGVVLTILLRATKR